jgi:hypothetical protein
MIIGLSGRKQSGKSTAGNFIYSLYISQLQISEKVYLSENGEIIVSDLLGDKNYAGVFNVHNTKPSDVILNKVFDTLNKYVRVYNFADILKKNICIDILGLSYEQCYGSDDDKNKLTTLLINNNPASAREIMQYVGTDIFRNLKSDVWVESTIKQILKDNPEIAIITDCRFPNEVDAIKNARGKVIRLNRDPFHSDHLSECVLDESNYDWSNFDYVINNKDYTLFEQVEKLKAIIEEILQL